MKTFIRTGAAVLALTIGAAAAQAQTTIITRETTGLSPEQRTTVYRTITRERRVVAPPPGVQITVGTRVPETVQLYDLPPTVYAEVPVVKRYRYMMVNDEVVLVDPSTSEVVEIIRP